MKFTMKTRFLLVAMLVGGALGAYAQTKGTNSIGLGFGNSKNKNEYSGGNYSENKSSNYSLRYAYFIKDNTKLGLSASYNKYENFFGDASKSENKGYGISLMYQKYFQLHKQLYVFAGGEAGYNRSESIRPDYYAGNYVADAKLKGNGYSLGAYGGVSYFLGKHLELDVRVLNASVGYAKETNKDLNTKNTSNGFSVNTSGSFTNLGFNINFLF